MAKRKRVEELEEPTDLYILVAGREEPLTAHRGFLSYFSTLVKDLPPREGGDQATWDLRDVVLEEDSLPVDAVTVQTWLGITYARLDDTLPVSVPRSLNAGLRLLKFADFAGTRKAVVRDIGSRIAQDQRAYLEVAVDGQHKPRLLLHGAVYYNDFDSLKVSFPADASASDTLVPSAAFRSHLVQFRSAVSSALEAALYLAARLDIPPLVLTLRNFVLNQLTVHMDSDRILNTGAIYSPRVLQNLPREVLVEAFLERAFTDLSADVKLSVTVTHEPTYAEDDHILRVDADFTSPFAAWSVGRPPGQRVIGVRLDNSAADQCVFVREKPVRIQVTSGGLGTRDRRTLVRKLLEDTAAAAAEGTD